MILLSWETPGVHGLMSLHAEVVRREGNAMALAVDVRAGSVRLTGGPDGHQCVFLLGFWEMIEPVSNATWVKRINALPEAVVAGLLRDLERNTRFAASAPREEMVSVLSRESMRRTILAAEVMGS